MTVQARIFQGGAYKLLINVQVLILHYAFMLFNKQQQDKPHHHYARSIHIVSM